jgi:membrane protease YdiL (CAAX protease family)
LGLTAAGALALVAANATVEEILFRGMYLDRMGVVGSSLFFGANHLVNAFVLPGFSFEEAGAQAAFATLFGLYAASRTEANGGDFRRMIALHYWHNVSTLVLGYLIHPNDVQLFQIRLAL